MPKRSQRKQVRPGEKHGGRFWTDWDEDLGLPVIEDYDPTRFDTELVAKIHVAKKYGVKLENLQSSVIIKQKRYTMVRVFGKIREVWVVINHFGTNTIVSDEEVPYGSNRPYVWEGPGYYE